MATSFLHPAPVAEWTILLYTGTVKNDFDETSRKIASLLQGARPTTHVNFVFEIGSSSKMRRGRVSPGSKDAEVLAEGPRIDTAAPKSIAEFVDWATELFPSRYTALVLKDHGDADDRPGGYVRSWLRPTPRARLGKLEIVDDGDAHRYLPNRGLRTAVEQTRNGHVDIYGVDACTMGSVEIAYELRDVASHFIATEQTLETTVFPYADAVNEIAEHGHVGPRRLAKVLVDKAPTAELVTVDLAWAKELGSKLDAVGADLMALAKGQPADVAKIRSGLTTFPPYEVDFDLLQLLDALGSAVPGLAEKNGSVAAAKKSLARSCYSRNPPRVVGKAGGLSIFFPPVGGHPFLATYGQMKFARRNRWVEFLSYFCWPGLSAGLYG